MNMLDAFPKQELIKVIELIDDLARCASEYTAEGLLTRARDLLMAEFAVCGIGTIGRQGRISINTILDSSYPGEWLNLYFKEGLYRFDPVVRHHMRFSEPELWSNIRKNAIDEKSKAVTEWAAAYGLKHGLSSSVYNEGTGLFSLFCFASSKDVFTEHHKDILSALTLHLNMAITERSGGDPATRKPRAEKGPLVQ